MAKRKHTRQQQTDPHLQELVAERQELEAERQELEKEITRLKEFKAWEKQLFALPYLTDQQKIDTWLTVAKANGILSDEEE